MISGGQVVSPIPAIGGELLFAAGNSLYGAPRSLLRDRGIPGPCPATH